MVTVLVPDCWQAVAVLASRPDAVTVYDPAVSRNVPFAPDSGSARENVALPVQVKIDPPAFHGR